MRFVLVVIAGLAGWLWLAHDDANPAGASWLWLAHDDANPAGRSRPRAARVAAAREVDLSLLAAQLSSPQYRSHQLSGEPDAPDADVPALVGHETIVVEGHAVPIDTSHAGSSVAKQWGEAAEANEEVIEGDYIKNIPVPGRTFESTLGAAIYGDEEPVSFSSDHPIDNVYIVED